MLLEHLIPCRNTHAVKEVTLSIFLDKKIDSIESYESFMSRGLSSFFKRFELIKAHRINFDMGKNNPSISQSEPTVNGFQFTNYDNGKPIQVFRGINEDNRVFFSFHELNYVRWVDYRNLFQKCISLIESKSDFKVKAYSLHFIDEFLWNSNKPIPYSDIFSKDNDIIPKTVLNSNSFDMVITKTKEADNGVTERIQLNGIHNKLGIDSKLVLSHNLSQIVHANEDIIKLIKSNSFMKRIDKLHTINKELLNNIFTSEITKRIKLNE